MVKSKVGHIDDYLRYYDNYSNTLRFLETMRNNVFHCHTQTSINLALLSFWVELIYATQKFEILKEKLKQDSLYAFCSNIDFRYWSKEFRKYTELVPYLPEKSSLDKLFTIGNEISSGLKNNSSSNIDRDKFVFSMLEDSITVKNHHKSSSHHSLIEVSKNVLPQLREMRRKWNVFELHQCIEGHLKCLSNILDDIHIEIHSPNIDALESLYDSFRDGFDSKVIENEIKTLSEIKRDRSCYINLLKNRKIEIFQSRICQYCDVHKWNNLFSWEYGACQPIYDNIGNLIHSHIDDDNKLLVAQDIIELTELWSFYNCELLNNGEDLNLEIEGGISNEIKSTEVNTKISNLILINGTEIEREFEDVINKISELIIKSANKSNWDILLFICKHYKIVAKNCSRIRFAEYLVTICPNLGDEKKLSQNMEKCLITASRKDDQYAKVLEDDLAKSIDELICPFSEYVQNPFRIDSE